MDYGIKLEVVCEGEVIYEGNFSSIRDLEEEGIRKAEGAIEGVEEKNKDFAEENGQEIDSENEGVPVVGEHNN